MRKFFSQFIFRATWHLFLGWLLFTLIAGPAVLSGLPTQAHAGVLDFMDFTIQDEIELGEKFATLIKAHMPLVEDPEIKEYVESVVFRIAKHIPPQPFPLDVNVLRNNGINAFAAPAGHVFVNTGLILNMKNESEMAGVIAHELAHVTQRHIASRIERMQAISLLSLAGMLAGALAGGEYAGAIITGSQAASQTAMLKYSRDDEREADQVGMNYLIAAGYPPQGLSGAFEVILNKQYVGGGGGIPTYLSTHPGLRERIGYLDQRIRRAPEKSRKTKDQNTRFKRVQVLIRARYTDAKNAIGHFLGHENKNSWIVKMGLGIAYERINMMKKARIAFEGALKKGSDDQLLAREAGIFYFNLGDFSKAGDYLQQAVMQNPKDLMALFFYARLLGEEQSTDQAAKYFKRILAEIPEDPEVHYYYGRVLGQGKDYFKAHLHLAYCEVYANRQRKARFHVDKAERLAATDAQKEELKELKEAYQKRSKFW